MPFPSTKPYSAVSVLTQLACAREKVLTVPAASFRPRPRVESCFVTFVRRPLVTPAEYAAVAPLVRLGFGHRRKVLTNTLGGAARAGVVLSRDDVRGALERLGAGPAARPEELTPPQWAELARLLGWVPLPDETTEST